jgi:hypothetical protein
MYNQDVKNRFLSFYHDGGRMKSSVDKAAAAFRLTEPFERREGKDLCAMDTEQIERMISDGIIAGRSFFTMFSALRHYVRWCVEEGVCGTSPDFLRVFPTGLEKIRNQEVFSDLDLKRRLDEVYGAGKTGQSCEVYRMYAWFAWAGIQPSRITEITSEQLNKTDLSIRIDGRKYILSPLARDTAVFLAESDSFEVENHTYKSLLRVPGTVLLRNNRGIPSEDNLKKRFAADFAEARKNGRTTSAISYESIADSSFYHTMYRYECAGADPDEVLSRGEAERGASRELYERWKLAFDRTLWSKDY